METRELILDAAVRLYAEAGFRGATTRRIAAEAGVNEVTLFRHFGTKEVLLREALRWAGRRVLLTGLPAEPTDPGRELTEWCREHLEGMYRVRALLRTSMGEHEEKPEVSAFACEIPLQVAGELQAYLNRLRERGLAAGDLDDEAASALLMGAVFTDAVSRDIMPERYPYSLDEAAERYVRLFLRAIAPVGGPGAGG
jgi:AcrR family transcriptional regulator